METKEASGVPQKAKILHRHLRNNVLLCEEKKDGKTVHFLFFPYRKGHMWITLEKMKEIVEGFEELVHLKSKKKHDGKEQNN